MANPERGGPIEAYQKFNKTTRNIALGVTVIGLATGIAPLISGGILFAAGDQAQITATDKIRNWRAGRFGRAMRRENYMRPKVLGNKNEQNISYLVPQKITQKAA